MLAEAGMDHDLFERLRFVCPRCRADLPAGGSGAPWECRQCGARYPVVESIPLLADGSTYYPEVERAEMERLIAETEQRPWRAVLHDFCAARNPYQYRIATDESRADWRFLVPLKPSWLVLDIGAGWGAITSVLARECAAVVACDTTAERLRFLQRRCRQEGLTNVCAAGANILRPPFAPAQFDLAVLVGVLEWVPVSHAEAAAVDPAELQQQALVNVAALLKPGGYCYLAIENRYGFKYMLGAPDDHTGLEHLAYLPRDEADRRARALLGQPYRTYTHDLETYLTLLRTAGFEAIQVYYPMPDYKTTVALAALDDTTALDYYLRVLAPAAPSRSRQAQVCALERAALAAGTLRQHAASFGFVARRALDARGEPGEER